MPLDNKIIILRFRDLVTPDGETFARHSEIIDKQKFVWWAWWKKGNEATPVNEFAALDIRAKSDPVDVYLVDSGQSLIYRAKCAGVELSATGKLPSPEKDMTPEYYRDNEYCAWFKFTEIALCGAEELRELSYLDSSSLFPDGSADYSRYDGKRIYSITELIQQNRTMWFARKAEKEDPDYEIILLNAELVQPCHFSKKYFQASGNKILWLSDLHLADRVFESKKGKVHKTLAEHIGKCIQGPEVAGLIVSGDITSCARKEGYDDAKRFLKELGYEVSASLGAANILICPGNHDFVREDADLPEKKEPGFIYDNPKNTVDFSDFYQSIYNIMPNKYFASGKKWLLSSGYVLEIAALNSLILQQYPNFEGHGYLSQDQLDYVAKEMGWGSENDRAIRAVMMHHHYLPSCYTEVIDSGRANSAVYDADRFMAWMVKHNVKLLLHGHKHRSFVSQVCYPQDVNKDIGNQEMKRVTIIGMGGTAAAGADQKIAAIRFERNEIVVDFYRLYSDEHDSDRLCQTVRLPL